jgi:RNA polymerase sigma-70 factor (ECF subfamily)
VTIVAQRQGPPDDEAPAEPLALFALVERTQAGDRAAFGELYQRTQAVVFRYVLFKVGSRHLAEDIAQEVYVRALRRIDSFTWQGTSVAAWLTTIARNLVADHYKRPRYRLEVLSGEVLDHDGPDGSTFTCPESAVLAYLQSADLLTLLQQLNAEQQAVLVARFWRGLSVSETAAEMGKNDGAVKALQYRATRAIGRLAAEAGVSR